MEILKPPAVAQILGCNENKVRKYIRRGIWTFGEFIPPNKTGKKTGDYPIYRAKLEKHIGRQLTDDEVSFRRSE